MPARDALCSTEKTPIYRVRHHFLFGFRASALVNDEESGEDTVVIAIQAEQTSAQELVGFRYLREGSHYV